MARSAHLAPFGPERSCKELIQFFECDTTRPLFVGHGQVSVEQKQRPWHGLFPMH